jgi:hypothetical protein
MDSRVAHASSAHTRPARNFRDGRESPRNGNPESDAISSMPGPTTAGPPVFQIYR